MLAPVTVFELNATGHLNKYLRLNFDATVPYFGDKHLPYAILAIVVFTVFVLLPTLLMILYPFRWFQKFLTLFTFRWYILHTFMDTFQGCYKDGTEPSTWDCRWFASVLLLVRILAYVMGAITLNSLYFTYFSSNGCCAVLYSTAL